MESSSKDSKLSLELIINLPHIQIHWYMLKCSFLLEIHHIFLSFLKIQNDKELGVFLPQGQGLHVCTLHLIPISFIPIEVNMNIIMK